MAEAPQRFKAGAPHAALLQFAQRLMRRRIFLAAAALCLILLILDRCFPPPIPDFAADGGTVVLARDGTPLRAFANQRGVWRYPITPEEVSPLYLEALFGYEDRWFYRHPGVNPFAMLRALAQAARYGHFVSGGSTLTMQVARLIEPLPKTGFGKLLQMVRALQIERRLSKREILTLYLNLAPMGGSIEGVQAASYAYLGKPALRLSHAEAALLAVLPQSPTRLRPDRNADAARAARDKVLQRLADRTIWDKDVLREARAEAVVTRRMQAPLSAALLAERVHQAQPAERRINTSIDGRMQALVEARVAQYLDHWPDKTSAAVLVIDNATREARAYVGSARFADPDRLGHIDMVRATRSPGSTLKPFLYGMALDDGLIHSESLLVDAPRDFDGYRPANFGENFNGPVSAADALRLSLNIPAVALLDALGPERFTARLANAGLRLEIPKGAKPNLAMILGGAGTDLEQLVGAYSALARGGIAATVRLDRAAPLAERQLMSAGAAWIVRRMLEDHERPGEAIAGIDRSRRARLAWKTGTSYGFRDAWAIGVTHTLTVGVWIGRPDGSPVPGHYGAATAAPLLFALVDALPHATQDGVAATPPDSVRSIEICWPLGTAADAGAPQTCRQRRTAWTLNNVVPPTLPIESNGAAEQLLVTLLVDARTGRRVRPDCASGATRLQTLAQWPSLAEPWIAPVERAEEALPGWSAACKPNGAAPLATMRIEGAVDGAILTRAPGSPLPPTLDLRALGGEGRVSWLLNGKLVGETPPGKPLRLVLDQPGAAEIIALDHADRYARVRLDVLR